MCHSTEADQFWQNMKDPEPSYTDLQHVSQCLKKTLQSNCTTDELTLF